MKEPREPAPASALGRGADRRSLPTVPPAVHTPGPLPHLARLRGGCYTARTNARRQLPAAPARGQRRRAVHSSRLGARPLVNLSGSPKTIRAAVRIGQTIGGAARAAAGAEEAG